MRLLPVSLPLLLLLPGCSPAQDAPGKSDVVGTFDTGGSVTAPDDTDEDTDEAEDTGTTEWPTSCEDRFVGPEAVPQDAVCDGGLVDPDWNLVPLWYRFSDSYSPPVVGQLDDDDGDGDVDADDVPDVILMDKGAVLYSIRGSDGTVNWSRDLRTTRNLLSAIADVNADGWPDVITDVYHNVTALDGRDGSTLWTGPASAGINEGTCGAYGVNDLDGDGTPEVYVGGMILDGATGVERGNGSEGDGLGVGNTYGHSVAVDLDGDGTREVVVGNAAYDADGNTVWANGGPDGTVAVADLDLDGSPEIVSVGTGSVRTMDAEGGTLWTYDLRGLFASTPVLADLTGDRYPEVVIPTSTSLIVLDGAGEELWTVTSVVIGAGRGGASAYDLDGNGAWEVIWAGPDGTQILNGSTGEVLATYGNLSSQCAGPVPVVDLDGDGHAELVVADPTGTLFALHDLNGFTDARPVWHQSDYSITNIEDGGGVPAGPLPNWMGDNNFRAGERIAVLQSVYPVVRDVCSDECSAGRVWLWYSLANDGWESIDERFTLEFWGETDAGPVLLGTTEWSGTVEGGTMTEGAAVELSGVPGGIRDIEIQLVAADDPEFVDCSTDDNAASWGAEVCP